MSNEMSDDPEITLIQWLSIDEVARYSDLLTTIEREEAAFEKFKERIDPNVPIIEDKEAFESLNRLLTARNTKQQIEREALQRIETTCDAWDKLKEMALWSIEALVDAGLSPDRCGGSPAFGSLVYQRILEVHAEEIRL